MVSEESSEDTSRAAQTFVKRNKRQESYAKPFEESQRKDLTRHSKKVVSKRERQRKTALVNDLYENKRKTQRWVKISRRELFVYNHFYSLSLSYFSYIFMSFVFFSP